MVRVQVRGQVRRMGRVGVRYLFDTIMAAVSTGFLVYNIAERTSSMNIAWMAGTVVFWILVVIWDVMEAHRRG